MATQGAFDLGDDGRATGAELAWAKAKAKFLGLEVRRSGTRGLYRLASTKKALVPIDFPLAMTLENLVQALRELEADYISSCQG